jgi:hypothetical protein
MKVRQPLQLYSNEWAVPYGLLGLAALLFALLVYGLQVLFPSQAGLLTNLLFIAVLLLLMFFYKRIYVCEISAQLQQNRLRLLYHKWPKKLEKDWAVNEIRYIGMGKTAATSFPAKAADKHWLLIEVAGKKHFVYTQTNEKALKGLFNQLLQLNADIVVRENIFR